MKITGLDVRLLQTQNHRYITDNSADITLHIFTDYFAIHSTLSCISHTRTAFEVRRTVVYFRGTFYVKYTYT